MTTVTRLLDELAEHGILRRIEFVRSRMHAWSFTAGGLGHVDAADPTNIDPEQPVYVRDDHPASRLSRTTLTRSASEPDSTNATTARQRGTRVTLSRVKRRPLAGLGSGRYRRQSVLDRELGPVREPTRSS